MSVILDVLYVLCSLCAVALFIFIIYCCCWVAGQISKQEDEEALKKAVQNIISLNDGTIDTFDEEDKEEYEFDGSGD